MTYTEWYKETYGEPWTENHAVLYSLVEEYEEYCKLKNQKQTWDG